MNCESDNCKGIVFYVAHIELPDKNALAHRVMANCFALRDAGYKPVLIGFSKDGSLSQNITENNFMVNGFECYNVPYPVTTAEWLKDMRCYKRINNVFEKYKNDNIYAIVCCGIGAANLNGITKYAHKHNINIVSDTVDWFEKYSGNIIRRTYRKFDERITVKYIKPKMHNIITISSFLYNYYNKIGCNTVIVPSLTIDDDKRFSDLPEYKKDDTLRFVYSGRPGTKGSKDRIDWCVRAFSKKAPGYAIFDIFGISREEFVNQFPDDETVASDERIIFHGLCDNKTCLEAVATADYSIFAREVHRKTMAGFPTKFSECFALGIPTVTTPTSDLATYIENGVTGFISKEPTYSSFEETFIQACNVDENQIMQIHENCKKDKRLSYTSYVEKFKEYFDNMK